MAIRNSAVITIMSLALSVSAAAAQNTPKEQTQLPAIQTPKAGATLPAVQTPGGLKTQNLPRGKASGDGSVRQPIGQPTPGGPGALPRVAPRVMPTPQQSAPTPGLRAPLQRIVFKARLSDPYNGALGGWNCTHINCERNTVGQMPDTPTMMAACRELQRMARVQRVKKVMEFGISNGPALPRTPPCPE